MSSKLGKECRMTYDEITLFRKFLTDKSMLNNFEYFYANHRFKQISIDDYYEQVVAEDVILDAFDMGSAGNTIFSFQYWKKLNEKWQRKLQEFRLTGKIIEVSTIKCAHCGRVLPKSSFLIRANGLLHKHCKECESGEWDKQKREKEKEAKEKEKLEKEARQLEKEIGEKQAKLQRLTGEAPTVDRQREKEIEHALNYAAQVSDKVIPEPITEPQKPRKMEDFTFFDFEKKSSLVNSIGPNKFAINNKRGNYTVVMNIEDSKAIIDANLMRLRLRQDNITGALHFVFNATVGATCIIKNKKNVTVANKDLVEFLIKALGYTNTSERVLVDISDNLSRTRDYVTFLIKKPKK